MSYSHTAETLSQIAVSSFLYRNVAPARLPERFSFFSADAAEEPVSPPPIASGVPQEEVDRLVAQAQAEAAAEVRRQLQADVEANLAAQNASLQETLSTFEQNQQKYFSCAETEVVQLALAIAARILHREAQVDPLLIAGLVRVAIEKLSSGSVTVRVCPEQAEYWHAYRESANNSVQIAVVEDPEMKSTACILQTEMGSADFSMEAQLKEVELGFCDLLALRPQTP